MCVRRPPPLQLHLRADGRHAVGVVLSGQPLLLGAPPPAAGHRLRGSAARGAHPPLQPADWTPRRRGERRLEAVRLKPPDGSRGLLGLFHHTVPAQLDSTLVFCVATGDGTWFLLRLQIPLGDGS